ncbi:MBL fold metallo-hydrolase [Bacteroidota bacterium]
MRITALVENTRLDDRKDLSVEHGLSLHIQRGDKKILFDTGSTDIFGDNAEKLGIDISDVDMSIISHHHFDHSGGLVYFFEANNNAKVYLKKCEEREYYFKVFGLYIKSVGMDLSLFKRYPDRFEFVNEFTEIFPDIFILTNIEKSFPLPKGNRYLFAGKNGKFKLDDFEHELIMVIREDDGLVVFSGCSHSGLLNIIDTVTKQFFGDRIKTVIGGFHLVGLPILNTMAGSKEEVEEFGNAIFKYSIDKFYTGHCTGTKAFRLLKEILGDSLEYMPTGRSVEI